MFFLFCCHLCPLLQFFSTRTIQIVPYPFTIFSFDWINRIFIWFMERLNQLALETKLFLLTKRRFLYFYSVSVFLLKNQNALPQKWDSWICWKYCFGSNYYLYGKEDGITLCTFLSSKYPVATHTSPLHKTCATTTCSSEKWRWIITRITRQMESVGHRMTTLAFSIVGSSIAVKSPAEKNVLAATKH